ncbi:MAG TPA: hypothetical protein VHE14_00440, partial [Solirubrobacteraceae bacterium]|nr:hypothetical protein [Solirubrobacteraceae bacterium]
MSANDPSRACDDFHRTSEAHRRRFLDGGVTRRQLVGWGLGAGLAVYGSKALSLAGAFEAAEADAAAAPNAPVLVSVFMPGGCDLLNTLVPLDQYAAYAGLRPTLKIDNPPQLPGTNLGIHPALTAGAGNGVAGLFAKGRIGLLPGIDYYNPDLSHFHSRHFWESGLITPNDATGWLGRYLDTAGSPDNPFQGLTMGYELSPVIRGANAPVASVSSPDGAQLSI